MFQTSILYLIRKLYPVAQEKLFMFLMPGRRHLQSPHFGPVDFFFRRWIVSLPPGVLTLYDRFDLVAYGCRRLKVTRWSTMVTGGMRDARESGWRGPLY